MVKAFAASALAFVALVGGGLISVACDSASDSTFAPEPPKPDAEDGPISPLLPEGGPGDGGVEAGPTSCPPAIPPTFAPTWTPPTKKAACTTEQLKGYYDA